MIEEKRDKKQKISEETIRLLMF